MSSIKSITASKPLRIFTALMLLITSFGILPQMARAEGLSSLQDTISDSRPGYGADHEIEFVTETGVGENTDTIIITFDNSHTFTDVGFEDMDFAMSADGTCTTFGTSKTLAGSAGAGTWGAAFASNVLTLTPPTDAGSSEIPAGRCVQLLIGTNASGGSDQILNPTAGSYDVAITGGFGDSGTTKIVIISTITADVTISETLTFTVTAQNSGDCTGGDINTTSTSIPFGTPSADTFTDGCQLLEAGTNASSGYAVTIRESDQLENSSADIIADGSCDGSCDETTWGAWATASGNPGFGYCLEDVTGTDANATAGDQCDDGTPSYKIMPDLATPEDPEIIMSNAGATSGSNAQAQVNFRLTFASSQPAGTYSNNIIYVATPTY